MKARTFLLAVMAFSITCLQAVAQNNNKRVLVAYFSATGTTAQAAAKLVHALPITQKGMLLGLLKENQKKIKRTLRCKYTALIIELFSYI